MDYLTTTLSLPPLVVANAVNRLSNKGTLKFFKGKDGNPVFKRVSLKRSLGLRLSAG